MICVKTAPLVQWTDVNCLELQLRALEQRRSELQAEVIELGQKIELIKGQLLDKDLNGGA